MDDVHPKMRFSLTPPPPKAIHSSTITTATATPRWNSSRNCSSAATHNSSADYQQQYQPNNNNNYNNSSNSGNSGSSGNNCDKYKMQRQEDTNSNKPPPTAAQPEEESTSDYKQWLHAMKLVARLPGGIPPEFRRKLWLSLADKYLKSKNVDWSKEEEKCFCEKWREDDEELGIQIVKDLHRTGSTLCTGPAGDVNQAKLKRILLGYARYNPEVGYCQGFNMLGALILQVMDKEEAESMKVMIYLVEGILPPGYFCGSMGGLQADMAVFRELMQTKLPRLARHLQKLQGPVENAYEPPLTNVFTMQWFLTMFCTCLPMSCVLRVWDLVLIEGSDVLLRTALALWSLLEERVLSTRSADDFYGKMGSFSGELLNGHLIDSNGLIEKVVQLGPIQDIQKLRDKHLYSVTPLQNKQGLNFYYDDDEPDIDEDSRLAVATVWGIPWGRRGSQGTSATLAKQAVESKDRIALDISLLKKQYDRLRERQKQAHIILTTACSTARQSTGSSAVSATLPVNQLLSGRPAIITNRGRRTGPPTGAIPPARKPSLPAVLQDKPLEKQLRRGETLQWRDSIYDSKRRRDSLTWKEIRAERAAMISSGSIDGLKSQKIRTKRLGKSDSSSYSEESEEDEPNDKAASSSDTSHCDDDHQPAKNGRKYATNLRNNAKSKVLMKQKKFGTSALNNGERQRPKSWAPSNSDIPFVLMTTESPNNSADEGAGKERILDTYMELAKEEENSATESDQLQRAEMNGSAWRSAQQYSPLSGDLVVSKLEPLLIHTDLSTVPSSSDIIHTTPPVTDVTEILAITKALSAPIKSHLTESTNSLGSGDGDGDGEPNDVKVSDEGVTNQYFERVNSTERPTKLELMYSLNEEDTIRDAYKENAGDEVECAPRPDDIVAKDNQSRCMDLLVDYSEKSSAACIAEAKTEISTNLQMSDYSNKTEHSSAFSTSAASKRRDPRRLTLTRSSTMEIEKRYQALEKRLSMEVSSKQKVGSNENQSEASKYRSYHTHTKSHAKDEQEYIEKSQPEEHRIPYPLSSTYSDDYRETSNPTDMPQQRKHVIPSTADLEERFENMIRDRSKQVSSVSDSEKGRNQRKTPPSPKESSRSESTKNVDKRQESQKSSNTGDSKKSAAQGDTTSRDMYSDRDSVDLHDVEPDNEDEDYSDRPTSAERDAKSNVARSEILRRKKEPPDMEKYSDDDNDYGANERASIPMRSTDDDGEYIVSDEDVDRSVTVSGNDSPVVDSEPEMAYDEEDLEDEMPTSRRESEHMSPERRQSEIALEQMAASHRQSEISPERRTNASRKHSEIALTSQRQSVLTSPPRRQSTVDGRSEVSSKAAVAKKSPPSTEELEKRFNALEKQMSISKSEASEEPPEAKIDTSSLEYDDRQSPDGFSEIDQQQIDDESQKSAAGSETADEVPEDRSRAQQIKASVIEAMKSSAHQSGDEGSDELNRTNRMAANVMKAMKTASRRSDEQSSESRSRSHKMATNVMDAMRSSSGRQSADHETERASRSDRIKAGVVEAMKSSSALPSPAEDSEMSTRSNKMAANVMEAMKLSARRSDDEEETEKHSRANRIKANVIEAIKSSPVVDPQSPTRSNKMASNVMEAMKSSSSRHVADDNSEKRSRSHKIRAGVIEAMKSSSAQPSPVDDLETPTRSNKMAANVMDALKSAQRRPDEDLEHLSRSDKIKAGVIAAMKSSSEHPSHGEGSENLSRSTKMVTNVMEAMKSSARRSDNTEGVDSPSRSNKMTTNVMDAMISSARRSDDSEGSGKLSRSDKIKAEVIAAMKSSSAQPSPDEAAETPPSKSSKMATNVMAAMSKSSHRRGDDDDEAAAKTSRSNRIKADVIEAMKSSSNETSEASRSNKMATNVMDAMKSSVRHKREESSESRRSNKTAAGVVAAMKPSSARQSPEEASEARRSNKMAANVMDAMKSSSVRHSADKDTEKLRRANKIKADVIEAMKSASDTHPTEEGSETRRSNKMATNVMDAMKSAVRRSPDEVSEARRSNKMAANVMDAMKSSSVRHSADKDTEKLRRSNKIKADVIEAMKSGNSAEAASETRKSTKMAANVMEAMKSSTVRRIADDASKQKSRKGAANDMQTSPEHPPAAEVPKSNKLHSNVVESSSGRRSSEPPSTEDLEKRYEILKRRMSSKNFETTKGKRSTTDYASDLDKEAEEPSSISGRSMRVTPKTSPPSTDSLERRFEKLQSESESGKSKIEENKKSKERSSKDTGSKQTPATKEKPPKDADSNRTSGREPARQQHQNIEHSPTETSESPVYKSPSQETGGRSALIEELQSKMGATPDGENIKPSSINPNRKPRPPHGHPILRKSKTDETSETHAANANSMSGKYEPLHSSNRKMVRRFSDVPSRADLENRLQFLEEKLSKTLFKQRRASDSEVASTSRRNHNIKPLPANLRQAGKLESRVRELEKQLSTSSKFSVTGKSQKSSAEPDPLSTSQMGLEITADSIDLTGKELVRYSHFGEVDEHDFQSPINISINIHMTLSKDDLAKTATQQLTRADELSRRLLILEQQLKDSQKNIAATSSPVDACDQDKPLSSDPPTSSQKPSVEEDEIRSAEVRTENAEPVSKEFSKEETHTAEVTNKITPEHISEELKTTQTSEPVVETSDNSILPKDSAHTSDPVEQMTPEPKPPSRKPSHEPEPVLETPLNVPEEVVTKKLDLIPSEQDFDRRLQILEQHMKNAQSLSASISTSRDSMDECQSSKRAVQSQPELPKPEAKKDREEREVNMEQSTKSIDKPSEESSCKPTQGDIESKLDREPDHTPVPTKQPSETEAQTTDIPVENLNATQMVPVEVNKKTLVLLLDNEPKAVKVRRLTRANTEELEDLFQALEKQLIERGQVRPEDVAAKGLLESETTKEMEMKMAHLTKEIMELSKSVKTEEHSSSIQATSKATRREEDFDWGLDPIKHHLKKKTAYLPSTRELESRFRSLERQIKQLEDVEKIDVEQRLTEIERKIKLQYSLSHEKDLNKFLDLCEGKGLDDTPVETPAAERREVAHTHSEHSHCAHAKKHQSPVRMIEPERVECSHSNHSHCAAAKKHQSPVRATEAKSSSKPTTEDLEYRFRALDLKPTSRPKPSAEMKREPIHPLEMLLDPSPEDIPTTGELEHRMRMLEEGRDTPSPTSRKSRSKSPVAASGESRPPLPRYESPSPSGLPTAEELEARLAALEKEHRFDFKMQKNYKQFNQKLKDIISPISPTFEEFKATRSSSAESATRKSVHRSPSPKVTVGCPGDASCSRTIRFHDEDEQHQRPRSRNDSEPMVSTNNDVIQILEENSNMIQRILKKTIADSHGGCVTVPAHLASSVQEGLGVMGIRLMRETSPLRRKGTHTGVPLRTGENINDQLTSIKNTIKSIDSLCEEKPYRTERCQQYIDSLCSDSTYFASKKSSLDDLTSRHHSRSRSREYGGPSIRISDHSPAFTRSMGSADSIRSSSPLRPTSPLQYHSTRDLRREISPRRRRDEEREENKSRVRRDNLLPNIYNTYNHSSLSQSSHSLTKFHKVDRQLISNDVDDIDVELQQTYRQPTTFSSNETTSIHDSNTNTSNTANNTRTTLTNVVPNTITTNDTTFKGSILDMPNSPYRQIGLARSNTPVYAPAKLEIRHTTVTSTFYDRVLTEKQLEKKHSTTNINAATTTNSNVPANRSPFLEQPPPLPVARLTDKYSPPNFPYPEMAALPHSAAVGEPDTAATTVVANQVMTLGTPPLESG